MNNDNGRMNRNHGFTILEILTTISILGFMTIALVSILALGCWRIKEAEDYAQAVQIAQGEMEYLLTLPINQCLNLNNTSKLVDDMFHTKYQLDHLFDYKNTEVWEVNVLIEWENNTRDHIFQLNSYRLFPPR